MDSLARRREGEEKAKRTKSLMSSYLEYKKSRMKSLLGDKNFEPVSSIAILSLATTPPVLLGHCCFLPSSQENKKQKTTEEVWICHSTKSYSEISKIP